MPEISIIMPLYNASKFLKESLNSVLSQTFNSYELICINDGSQDETLSVLEEYQKKDSRIIILQNKERLGAAYSRNKGIQQAKGRYIIFLDGDDIFEEEMLGVTYETAKANNTDVLMFELKHTQTEQISTKLWIYHGQNFIRKYCNKVFRIEDGYPYEFLLWSTSPCNKLFKKNFIKKNNICFQTLPSCNDVFFVNLSLILAERIMFLRDNRVMVYARDHSEASRISLFRDPMCCYYAYEYIIDVLIEKQIMCDLYTHIFYKAIFAFRDVLLGIKDENQAREFYNFLQNTGINRLYNKSIKYSKKKNMYVNYLFNSIINHTFEKKWLEEENLLKVCIQDKKDEFCELFKKQRKQDKIVVWGIGKNGRIVLEMCNKYNITIDYVVDENIEKQGKYVNGYPVIDPDKILFESVIVISTPKDFSKEIEKKVLKFNITSKVIDISEYMGII